MLKPIQYAWRFFWRDVYGPPEARFDLPLGCMVWIFPVFVIYFAVWRILARFSVTYRDLWQEVEAKYGEGTIRQG